MRDPAVRYWFSCHLLLLRKLIVKYGKNGVFVWFQNGKFWKRFIQPSLIVFYQRRSEISIIWLLAGIIENFKNSVHNISCILIDILLIWFDYRQQSCIRILLSFDDMGPKWCSSGLFCIRDVVNNQTLHSRVNLCTKRGRAIQVCLKLVSVCGVSFPLNVGINLQQSSHLTTSLK